MAAGSAVAVAQSIGAAGMGAVATTAVGAAGGFAAGKIGEKVEEYITDDD